MWVKIFLGPNELLVKKISSKNNFSPQSFLTNFEGRDWVNSFSKLARILVINNFGKKIKQKIWCKNH